MTEFNNFLGSYYSWVEVEKALNILVREIAKQNQRINHLELRLQLKDKKEESPDMKMRKKLL
jgi:vacuolar-type H+-ATPase subunit D/Vma8